MQYKSNLQSPIYNMSSSINITISIIICVLKYCRLLLSFSITDKQKQKETYLLKLSILLHRVGIIESHYQRTLERLLIILV